jgi:translation initiation factor 2B subunit (eIF-2B alpha/beta/delta family)
VIDQDNKILRNQKYTVKDHFFTVSIDKLVEEDDEFGGKVLNGKRYDSIPKAIIDVLIAK